MASRGIKNLIDRFGPENVAVKECMKQIIYPEDVEGFELEDVIERLSTLYILGDEQDDREKRDFSVQNPFTGIWLHCCGSGEKKIPYVDGMLTPNQLKSLIGKHVPLPAVRLKQLVAGAIKPQDIPPHLSFPEIILKLKNMWHKYRKDVDVLLFENPFTGKVYSSVYGEPAK